MSLDLLLIGGVVILALSLPSLVTALTSRHSVRYPLAIAGIGAGFLAVAFVAKPGGYTFQEIPDAVSRVAGMLFG